MIVLQFPALSPILTIQLPNPELGDSVIKDLKTKYKITMDGSRYSYISTPTRNKYIYTFNTLNRRKIQELKNFINKSAGFIIRLTDYNGISRYGAIINNPFELITIGRGIGTIETERQETGSIRLEFQIAEYINGDYKDPEIATHELSRFNSIFFEQEIGRDIILSLNISQSLIFNQIIEKQIVDFQDISQSLIFDQTIGKQIVDFQDISQSLIFDQLIQPIMIVKDELVFSQEIEGETEMAIYFDEAVAATKNPFAAYGLKAEVQSPGSSSNYINVWGHYSNPADEDFPTWTSSSLNIGAPTGKTIVHTRTYISADTNSMSIKGVIGSVLIKCDDGTWWRKGMTISNFSSADDIVNSANWASSWTQVV